MNTLLIATTNQAKLKEITLFLQDLPIQLVSLNDVGITQLAPEDGATFEENAIQKAKYYFQLSGLPTLADDGGFEIDALNGEPGVKSHRWVSGDKEDSDDALIAYTMQRLQGVPLEKRTAQLRLVLAFIPKTGMSYTVEEFVKGVIPIYPADKRTAGFPFRSLLFLPEINKYYDHDVLTPEETKIYNHRGRAVLKLKPIIGKFLTE